MNYINGLENNINEICRDCSYKDSEKCNFRKCNVGFANYVIQNIKDKSINIIEGGEYLIPKDDMRYYDERIIAGGIANTLKMCKGCNENHNEDCVIALIRRTLEYTQLKDRIAYPGNMLGYLVNLSKQKPEFGELIKQEYMNIP